LNLKIGVKFSGHLLEINALVWQLPADWALVVAIDKSEFWRKGLFPDVLIFCLVPLSRSVYQSSSQRK
jgi:hypothetical protein